MTYLLLVTAGASLASLGAICYLAYALLTEDKHDA
jgi:hypothetical protein